MKITYDNEVDALYVYFNKGKVQKTKFLGSDFLVDIDKNENVLGIEVLNATKHIRKIKEKSIISFGNKSFVLPELVK